MNQLGKLLRSVRLRKNISELKAARRAGMSLEEYVQYEYSPEKVPLSRLNRIFNAIEMSQEEYVTFSELCMTVYQTNSKEPDELKKNFMGTEQMVHRDTIPLQNLRGIKKASPKTRKSIKPDKI